MKTEQTVQKVALWVAIGALFLVPFLPLVVANGLFFPFITGKAFMFRVLVEVALAAWVLLACLDKRFRPQFSWLGALLVIFVVWMFVADCFAVNPAKAFWSNFERMEGWVTLVHLLALFLVAGSVLTVKKLWRPFWLTSLGVSLLVGLYGVMQLAGLAVIHQGGVRLDATLGNAEYLAVYFLFHIFIAGWLAVEEYKKGTWLAYGLPLLALFETYLLFETQTRGAVLGLVLGALVAAFLSALTAGGRARKLGLAAVVAVLVLAGGFFLARNTSFVQQSPALTRIASISLDQGSTRFTLWHMAYEGFLVRPVLGWGQEGYSYVFDTYYQPSLFAQEAWFDRAHNSFIDWLVAGGLPAFLLYLSIFLGAFWFLWKRSGCTSAEKIGITALLVAYAVHSFFVFDNLISSVLFILVIAYIHQRSSRPMEYFTAMPELSLDTAQTVGVPVAVVLCAVVVWFVNVPGLQTGGNLITAITPTAAGPSAQLAVFKDLLTHPAFAEQEVAEQLVSFAVTTVNNQSATAADKSEVAAFTVSEMQKLTTEIPLDPRLRLEFALAYRVAGDTPNALKQYAIAESLSPKKQSLYLEEGMARWAVGDTAGAKTVFDKAYSFDQSFTDLAAYAAVGDVITGNSAGADTVLTAAFGTTTVANETLMRAYYYTKDWPRLIKSLEKNVTDQHGAVDAWFRLAAGYVNAGDLSSARKAVQSGIAAHPEATAEGQQLLAQLDAMAKQQ